MIDATGKPKGWRDAVSAVRRGGTVIFFSGVSGGIELDAERIHYDELTLRGAFHHTPQTVRAALAFLASGAYPWREAADPRGLTRGSCPRSSPSRRDGYLKAIVRP